MKQIIDSRDLIGKEIKGVNFLENGDVLIRLTNQEFCIMGQTPFIDNTETSLSSTLISHTPDEYNYIILYILGIITKGVYRDFDGKRTTPRYANFVF